MNATIEDENVNYDEIIKAIESTRAVVHSLNEIAIGDRVIPRIRHMRRKP